MQLKRADVSKKPYKTPVLIVHGTVKELTQKIGRKGTLDGRRIFRIRTHV